MLWGGFAGHPSHDFRNPVFENRGLQNWASGDSPSLPRASGVSLRAYKLRLSPSSPPDRSANVTRHRRAPAGRPSAGVRAGGSSGPWVRLYGREGRGGRGARRGPRGPRSSASHSSRSPPRKRDRDAPSDPAALPRSPLPGGGTAERGRPQTLSSGASAEHRVSRTLRERNQPLQLPISLGRAPCPERPHHRGAGVRGA